MNGCNFRGNYSAIIIFASFVNGGQLLKERICSHRSKFFPLRVDQLLELCSVGKQTEIHEKLFPFADMMEKHGDIYSHFKPVNFKFKVLQH